MDIILVSTSPRRKQILENAGLKFYIETVEISEIIDKNLNITQAVSQVATDKMQAFLKGSKVLKYKDFLAITADTIVCVGKKYLGKPKTKEQAVEYLRLLSDRTHAVHTGVNLYHFSTNSWVKHCETTQIQFKSLSDAAINKYIDTYQPFDKAGAYGIQDEMAYQFIYEIKGSLNNVVGFPIEWLNQTLEKKGWI